MLLVCDFETYYDKDYSLSKMTTEAYIRDRRFYVHGVGLKIDDRPTKYFRDVDVAKVLSQLPWERIYMLAHNCRFDAAILNWRYGHRPAFLLDTLSMARAVFPHESSSLANISILCGLGKKGDELASFLGVKRLTPEQQIVMGGYCSNDVDLTYDLFQVLKVGFPASELRVIDNTLRMFTEPILEIDPEILLKHKAELDAKRAAFLQGRDLTALRSNPQFAKLLEDFGVEPPMKVSAKTKKPTFAFSKTDEGMLALLEHPKIEVQELVAARLGVKSSIEMTRTDAFLGVHSRGNFPVALNYFGAQNTGRFSGGDGGKGVKGSCNVQNLTRGGALRKSIVAPEGYVLAVSDFNAIEARVISWLAGEEGLLKVFREGGDPYCSFASRVYGRTITKADKAERFLGKVSILGLGYSLGWRKFAAILAVGPLGQPPIIFTEADLYAMNGKIIDMDTKGITTKLTGDALQIHCSAAKHLVTTYRETYRQIPAYWKTCDKVLQCMFRGVKHQFGVISTGKDKVFLPNGLSLQYKGLHADEDDNWRYFGKRGEKQYIYSGKMAENCLASDTLVVVYSGIKPIAEVTENDLVWDGETWVHHDGVVDNGLQEVGEWLGIRITKNHLIHDGDFWKSAIAMGEKSSLRSLESGLNSVPAWWNDGRAEDRIYGSTLDASAGNDTTLKRKFFAAKPLQYLVRYARTNEQEKKDDRKKILYRLALFVQCGRTAIPVWFRDVTTRIIKRIQTMAGEVFTSTRHGWMTGRNSFATPCLSLDGMILPWIWIGKETTKDTSQEISDFAPEQRTHVIGETPKSLHTKGLNIHTKSSVQTSVPNGRRIPPDGISIMVNPQNGSWRVTEKRERVFDIMNSGPKNRFMVLTPYGPVLVHNCTQAIARIVLTDAQLEIAKKYKTAMTVHDEIVCCVKEEEGEDALAFMLDVMSQTPKWAQGLPVAAEGGISTSYGEAK